MTNGTAPTASPPPGAKMTIRVYTVTREGTVRPPRAVVTVPHAREAAPPVPLDRDFPPCACPRCRQAGEAR
ncbi:hypothetical protein E0E62_11255 [Streptomyces sp. 16-176A]